MRKDDPLRTTRVKTGIQTPIRVFPLVRLQGPIANLDDPPIDPPACDSCMVPQDKLTIIEYRYIVRNQYYIRTYPTTNSDR